MVAQADEHDVHPAVAAGPKLRRRRPGRAHGPRSQDWQTAVHADHADDGNSSRYVIAGFPGADWVRNARAAGEATLQHGRHTERVRMVELSSEDARPVLRAFPTEVPTGVTFMKRFGLVKDAAPRCSASTLSKLSLKVTVDRHRQSTRIGTRSSKR